MSRNIAPEEPEILQRQFRILCYIRIGKKALLLRSVIKEKHQCTKINSYQFNVHMIILLK
jgi:hypothetical protein